MAMVLNLRRRMGLTVLVLGYTARNSALIMVKGILKSPKNLSPKYCLVSISVI